MVFRNTVFDVPASPTIKQCVFLSFLFMRILSIMYFIFSYPIMSDQSIFIFLGSRFFLFVNFCFTISLTISLLYIAYGLFVLDSIGVSIGSNNLIFLFLPPYIRYKFQ